jgi:hypothetical protein
MAPVILEYRWSNREANGVQAMLDKQGYIQDLEIDSREIQRIREQTSQTVKINIVLLVKGNSKLLPEMATFRSISTDLVLHPCTSLYEKTSGKSLIVQNMPFDRESSDLFSFEFEYTECTNYRFDPSSVKLALF